MYPPSKFPLPDPAKCPLPDCGDELYVTIFRGGVVYQDGTIDDRITSSWEVECGAGHKILLPPDDAADYHEWDEDASARLRKLVGTDSPLETEQ